MGKIYFQSKLNKFYWGSPIDIGVALFEFSDVTKLSCYPSNSHANRWFDHILVVIVIHVVTNIFHSKEKTT